MKLGGSGADSYGPGRPGNPVGGYADEGRSCGRTRPPAAAAAAAADGGYMWDGGRSMSLAVFIEAALSGFCLAW